ncbi:MAG: hypothetical protein WBP81_08990 [Solirubrobacteraceae bacterium]
MNNRVQKFDSSGNLLSVIGGGAHGGELDLPTGVSTDAQGNLYVAEEGSNRISKFDSAGHFLLAFGKDVVTGGGTGFELCTVAANCKAGVPGDQAGAFNFPEGIATDAAGNVYVSDLENGRIAEFDSSGNLLRVITSRASSGLISPAHVSTDAAGDLYVADAGNSRIQEFADALAPPPPPPPPPHHHHHHHLGWRRISPTCHSRTRPGVWAASSPPSRTRRRSGPRSGRGSPSSSTRPPA